MEYLIIIIISIITILVLKIGFNVRIRDIEKIKNYLNTMDPLMMEVLNVNLEEVFIYEMEKKGVFENV